MSDEFLCVSTTALKPNYASGYWCYCHQPVHVNAQRWSDLGRYISVTPLGKLTRNGNYQIICHFKNRNWKIKWTPKSANSNALLNPWRKTWPDIDKALSRSWKKQTCAHRICVFLLDKWRANFYKSWREEPKNPSPVAQWTILLKDRYTVLLSFKQQHDSSLHCACDIFIPWLPSYSSIGRLVSMKWTAFCISSRVPDHTKGSTDQSDWMAVDKNVTTVFCRKQYVVTLQRVTSGV